MLERESHPPSSREGCIRVLVAEDNDDARDMLVLLLRADGFSVTGVRGGSQALDLLGLQPGAEPPARSYDVVVSDVRMGAVGGMDVLTRMRAAKSDIPVVLVSGHATDEMHDQARVLGASAFLDKPLSPSRLRAAVRDAVDPPWW
jgi:CheY-like chemotaxis protein